MISDDVQPETESGEQDQVSGAVNGGSPTEAAVAPENEQQSAASAVETTEATGEEQATPAPRRQRTGRGGGTSRRQRGGATAAAVEELPPVTEAAPPPRLLEIFRTEIVPTMIREFGFPNPMRVPRVEKIVLNIGVGEALTNSRAMEGATTDLTTISGQKPVITRARKSIAGFKIR